MSTPFKMPGFSGFGNSPVRQDVTKMKDQELVHFHTSLESEDERNDLATTEISNRYKRARSGGKKFEGSYTVRYNPDEHKYSWNQPNPDAETEEKTEE